MKTLAKIVDKIIYPVDRLIADDKVFHKVITICGCIFVPAIFVGGFWNPIHFFFAVIIGVSTYLAWQEYRKICREEEEKKIEKNNQ